MANSCDREGVGSKLDFRNVGSFAESLSADWCRHWRALLHETTSAVRIPEMTLWLLEVGPQWEQLSEVYPIHKTRIALEVVVVVLVEVVVASW